MNISIQDQLSDVFTLNGRIAEENIVMENTNNRRRFANAFKSGWIHESKRHQQTDKTSCSTALVINQRVFWIFFPKEKDTKNESMGIVNSFSSIHMEFEFSLVFLRFPFRFFLCPHVFLYLHWRRNFFGFRNDFLRLIFVLLFT